MGYSRILKNSEFATAEQGVKADTAVQNLADIQAAFNSGTVLEKNEFMSSLGGVVLTDIQARTDTGPYNHMSEAYISDGNNRGTPLRWYQPPGVSTGYWGWGSYPQSRYEG